MNRLCSSGLEAIAQADMRIRTGGDKVVIAGGAESMSLIPMGGNKPSPNPWLAEHYPASLLTMGLTAERVARHYHISRDDQDAFALGSHRRALAAQAAGRFTDELIPVTGRPPRPQPPRPASRKLKRRPSPPMKARARTPQLKRWPSSSRRLPHRERSLPATLRKPSDGAAAAVLMEAGRAPRTWASQPHGAPGGLRRHRLPAGGDGRRPRSTPSPKRLSSPASPSNDIGVIELNEAFAAQALAVIRTLGLDPEKVNVNGGAIALGHPLGCTGAKLTATLLREMATPQRPLRHGHHVRRRRHGRRRHLRAPQLKHKQPGRIPAVGKPLTLCGLSYALAVAIAFSRAFSRLL